VPSLTVVLKLSLALEVLPSEMLQTFGFTVMGEMFR
jgi:hypothetical protein